MNPLHTFHGKVAAVNRSAIHSFQKPSEPSIVLLAGLGVEGDAHMGTTVKHRSRVAKDPTQPNLRQVHLIHTELFDELAAKEMPIHPGQLGENVTTTGIDILGLPKGALLHLGNEAVIEITGLRNPCHQFNQIYPGLLDAMLDRDIDGNIRRKAGVMAIVLMGGTVNAGDAIRVVMPDGDPVALLPV